MSFLPAITAGMGLASGVMGLFGRRKAKADASNLGYDPAKVGSSLTGLGDYFGTTAKKSLGAATDYFTPLAAGDPAALAKATASSSSDIAGQVDQLTKRALRAMPRGGAQASVLGELPTKQMGLGLRNRIEAQRGAAETLGNLGLGEGGLAERAFGGLLGHATDQDRINLQRTIANRQFYGDIGGGIWNILTGKGGFGGEDSILSKIGGIFRGH